MYIYIYYQDFNFGIFKFGRGALWKYPACENLNFEIIFLAEAPAETSPPAKFWISKLYFWPRHLLKIDLSYR